MKQDPQTLADAVRTHLVAADQKINNLLGMVVEEMTLNRVVCSMMVRDDMVNSHLYCQGGLIFTLADHAFAYACMSSNKASVTLSAQIIFTHPAKLGDTLTATAEVITESGRTATCDVTVTNQEGKIIARCSGVNYRLKKPLVEEYSVLLNADLKQLSHNKMTHLEEEFENYELQPQPKPLPVT